MMQNYINLQGTQEEQDLLIQHGKLSIPGNLIITSSVKDVAGRLAHLSPPFDGLINAYLRSLGRMAHFRNEAIAEVTQELDFIYETTPRLLAPSEKYDEIGPFELHRLEKQEEALNDSILRILENVNMHAVASMSLEALRSAERAVELFQEAGKGRLVATARYYIGHVYLGRGDLKAALRSLQEAEDQVGK